MVRPSNDGAHSGRFNSFKIASCSNPLEEMGRIEYLAAETRSAGITLYDHILYTIFIIAPPAKY